MALFFGDLPFVQENLKLLIIATTYEIQTPGGLSFESSRVVPTAEENRPVNVALPVCIYLGLPA